MGLIFDILKITITILLSIYGSYFVVRFIISLFYKKKEIEQAIEQKRFAILIPARNEENTIGQLVESLQRLNYPKDKYSIYTVVNNSTDNTKKIALANGSNVIEATNVKCKADALRQAFDYLKNDGFDYYVIFDADNLVDKNFLMEMNNFAFAGYKVAQCKRCGKNTGDSWISGSYDFYYLTQNICFNSARMKTDNAASINGTGWMVAKSVIDEIGFPTVTLTEDIEFSAICTLNNIPIGYCDKAITYDEYACDFKTSWIQRKRWSTGCVQCAKEYVPTLLKSFIKTKKMMCLDYVYIYMTPIIQIVATIAILLRFIDVSTNGGLLLAVLIGIVPTFTGYISTMMFTIVLLLSCNESLQKYSSTILGFGLFIMSWAAINIVIFIKKTDKWEPIAHTRAISIEQLNK